MWKSRWECSAADDDDGLAGDAVEALLAETQIPEEFAWSTSEWATLFALTWTGLLFPCSVQRMLRSERLACSKLISWCTVPLLMTSCLHGQKPDVVFLTKLTALLFETHKESSVSFCGKNCLMRRFMLSWQTWGALTIFSSTPHDSNKMFQLLASASRQRSDLPWLQHKYNRTTFLSMIINGVPRCLAHLLLKALEKICQNALQIWL